MAKEDLIPADKRSLDETKEMGKKGGKASGKARRKKRMLKDVYKAILETDLTDSDIAKKLKNKMPEFFSDSKTTAEDLMGVAIWRKALAGDVSAAKEIADRIEGKPKQPFTGGEKDDNPISILANVRKNNSDRQDSGAKQKD